jgi:hypothetical protein
MDQRDGLIVLDCSGLRLFGQKHHESTIDIMQISHVSSLKRIEDRHDFRLDYLPGSLKKMIGKPVRARSLVHGRALITP